MLIVVVALGALGAVLLQALAPVVRDRVAARLEALGVDDPRFEVESVGLARTRIVDVQLGTDLTIDAIEITYGDPLALLEGRIREISLEGAEWSVPLDADAIAASTPARLLSSGDGSGEGAVVPRVRIARTQIRLEREGAAAITLDVEGDVTPGTSHGSLIVRSPAFAHAIDVVATSSASGVSIFSSITRLGDPHADPLVVSVALSDGGSRVRWDVAGPLPPELALETASIELGDVRVASRGEAHAVAPGRWALDDVRVDLDVAHAYLPAIDTELDDVSARLVALGTVGDDVDVQLAPTSVVRIGEARLPEARLEQVELDASVGLAGATLDTALLRALGDVRVRARTFAIGDRPGSEIRFGAVDLAVAPHADLPLVQSGADESCVSLAFAGTAGPVSGALRGRDVRIEGRVDARIDAEGSRVSVPLRLAVAELTQPLEDVSLARARFELPLVWDAEGRLTVSGHASATTMSWGAVDVGEVSGTLRIARDRLALDWSGDATADARFRLRVAVGLATGRAAVDIDVPPSEVRAEDAFHRALVAAVGVRVLGRAGGALHVRPDSEGGGHATVVLDGASIADVEDRGAAGGVRGAIALASIDPPVSVGSHAMTFSDLSIGGLLRTRGGSARVRFGGAGVVEVEDAVAQVGGGQLRAAPFGFAPGSSEVALALSLESISMERLVAMMAPERASASGTVDGTIALRVQLGEAPRVILGEGRLAARGPGRLRIAGNPAAGSDPIDLEELSDGQWIQRRVVAALSDFAYSRLVLDVVEEGGTSHLHASISGRGASTPQAIDLDVDVDDAQLLLDRSLRLMPRDPHHQPHVRS